jgi:hypothetical protein
MTLSGIEITTAEELLLRQVSPGVLDEDGEPSSSAFAPRPVDRGLLSVDRNSLTTAAAAYILFTTPRILGFGAQSAGVWALSVCEVNGLQGAPLRAIEDPLVATPTAPADPAHALVDFTPYKPTQQKKIGQRLKILALARGRCHP